MFVAGIILLGFGEAELMAKLTFSHVEEYKVTIVVLSCCRVALKGTVGYNHALSHKIMGVYSLTVFGILIVRDNFWDTIFIRLWWLNSEFIMICLTVFIYLNFHFLE